MRESAEEILGVFQRWVASHKKRVNSICLDFIEDHQGICYFMKLANIDVMDKANRDDDPY